MRNFVCGVLAALTALAALPLFAAKPETSGGANGTGRQLGDALLLDAPPEGTASCKLVFPAVKVPKGKIAVLRFNSRIVTPTFGGYNNYLVLKLNGKRIDRETPDGENRLLRRGDALRVGGKRPAVRDWWTGSKGQKALILFFAPADAVQPDKTILNAREAGFVYEVVVDDLVSKLEVGADLRVEKNEPNTLEITYLLTRKMVGGRNLPLSFKDAEIVFMTPEEADKLRPAPAPAGPLREKKPAAAALEQGIMTLEAAADGSLQLDLAGETFFLDSAFSYPAKPAMRFNTFGPGDAPQAGWRPEVRREGDALVISGVTPNWSIVRKITPAGHRFNVRDELKNTGTANAAMALHEQISGATLNRRKSRLAGQSGVSGMVDFFSTSNPTVFARGRNAAVGLVYEDTVSRAQLRLVGQGSVLRAGSAGCGAAPGDTIVREWAIYPMPTGNYYDFINQVRRDWQVNSVTIPGPYGFSTRGPQPPTPAKLASVNPWFEFCHYGNGNSNDGALLSRDEFVRRAKPQIAALRAKRPDVRIFGRLETNLVPFDCRRYPWAAKIRLRGVNEPRGAPGIQYGQFLNRELTAELDKVTPLADSVIRSEDGRAMIDNMYPAAPVVNLMVQPEIGNARFKQMLEQIDFLLDTVGVDSIYLDQFQPYRIGGFSENRWDGCTVELNPDGTIKRFRYSYALTGATARAAIIKHVRDKGGLVLTNGQPMSREEQSLGGLAFQEMENDSVNPLHFMDEKPPEFRWQTISHLGCPIALGVRPRNYVDIAKRPNRAAEVQIKGLITALRNGLLYYVYIYDIHADGREDAGSFAVFEHMFPFTPVELNEGFVVGKERVITAVSGTWTLGGTARPVLHRFNSRGIPCDTADFSVSGKPGAWQVQVKLKDWCEVAVLEVAGER